MEKAEGLNQGWVGWCCSGKDVERQGKWRDASVSGESKAKMGRWALLTHMALSSVTSFSLSPLVQKPNHSPYSRQPMARKAEPKGGPGIP